MTKDELFGKVKEVLVETFELDESEVVAEASLYEDLDLDSLDAIDLAVRLGSETGIKLKEEEMRSIRKVHDIVDVVHNALNAAPSAKS